MYFHVKIQNKNIPPQYSSCEIQNRIDRKAIKTSSIFRNNLGVVEIGIIIKEPSSVL